ncbi:MAG: biopolymer transporter ExbD [Gammaproteobacteria bacterium]|nr:biopolymer transporter ExbD [Gammaproteobacteria bacterium]
MNIRPSRRREDPDVNLTPLIDVVFLLLIFFMVSTTFTQESEISIELPQAAGETQVEQKTVIEISIDAQGRYYVNQKQLINTQLTTLKRALQTQAGSEKEPRLILSADRRTPHEAVVRAMDAARQLGFVELTFATQNNTTE